MYTINVKSVDIMKSALEMSTVHRSLQQGFRLESKYAKPMFVIQIQLDSFVQFITRKWWEQSYLRIQGSKMLDYDNNIMEMQLTLSEAIDFIIQVTPPLLQSQINESIRSLEDIRDILRTYLIEHHPGDEENLYRSKFQKMTMLERETNVSGLTTNMKNTIAYIRKYVYDGIICNLFWADHRVKKRFNPDTCAIVVFACDDRKQLVDLFKILPKNYAVHDFYRSTQFGYLVTVEFCVREPNPTLDDILQRSYAFLKV